MTGQTDPIKLITTAPVELKSVGPASRALVDLQVRTITINSISFWRSEEGILFLRGYDEEQHRTVDLIASSVRFVA